MTTTEPIMPGPNATPDTIRTALHVLNSVAWTVLMVDVDAVHALVEQEEIPVPKTVRRVLDASRSFRAALLAEPDPDPEPEPAAATVTKIRRPKTAAKTRPAKPGPGAVVSQLG
jgi:hypothetical protein